MTSSPPPAASAPRPPSEGPAPAPGWTTRIGRLIPGLGLAATLGALATALAWWVGVEVMGYPKSPISAIPIAVLLGLVVRDTAGVAPIFDSGLRFCVRRLLRLGVVLLGIRLSLTDAGATGLIALPLVVACIAAALLIVGALSRLLSIPGRLGTLIAVGTSICGVTAIVATAPVIEASEDEVSYAVATIALFGTLALFTYPWIAHVLFADPRHAGLFLGTAIHDTSQVAGAALTFEHQFGPSRALDVAVVTKLVRNALMVAVIPLVSALHRRGGAAHAEARGLARLTDAVPLFIVGFLLMATVRTVGDMGSRPFGVLEPAAWDGAIIVMQQAAEMALLLAMAGVGLGTSLRRLRVLGMRPLAVGLAAALCVGGISTLLISLYGIASQP